jgi:hypothetical protein
MKRDPSSLAGSSLEDGEAKGFSFAGQNARRFLLPDLGANQQDQACGGGHVATATE